MRSEPVFDFSEITPEIYLGTNMCCQMHFDEQLLKKGITVDISLEGERIDAPFGVEGYHWFPVRDGYAPTPRQLSVAVGLMRALVDLQYRLYIHCKNGHGRAPTLLAAYFISQGMSVNQAIAAIARKRPTIHLNARQKNALIAFSQQRNVAAPVGVEEPTIGQVLSRVAKIGSQVRSIVPWGF